MEYLSNIFVDKFKTISDLVTSNNESIFIYGTQVLLSNIFNFLTLIIIGTLFNILDYCFIFFYAMVWLNQFLEVGMHPCT